MSNFIDILSNKRRLKAQLKNLSLDEIAQIKGKFDEVYTELEAAEEENKREQEAKQKRIEEIRAKAEEMGISLQDLVGGEVASTSTKRAKKPPKFQIETSDGSIKTWTGQGRMPNALKSALEKGHSLEEFRI
jgi:DNA-binding protein H-NS